MGTDKLNLSGAIKLSTLVFYLAYFIFFNAGLNIYFPAYKKSDAVIKENLIEDSCLLALGGSNVRQGISARLLSNNICPTLNLGINGEMSYFELYHNWLTKNLTGKRYKYIIYSPRIFWADKLTTNENSNFIGFPGVSLFTQLRSLIIDAESIFNSYGDIENYNCNSKILPFDVKEIDFSRSNAVVTQEIKSRLLKLEGIASADNIYARVPPVYVKTKEQAKIYTRLMNERIKMLKGQGVKIIESTIVSTDSNLFCDSFHPNSKGREAFTAEIRLK